MLQKLKTQLKKKIIIDFNVKTLKCIFWPCRISKYFLNFNEGVEEVDVVLLHNVTDLVATDGIVLDNISDLEFMDESIQNDINNIEENFDNLEQFINGKGSFILVRQRFFPLIFVDAAVALM